MGAEAPNLSYILEVAEDMSSKLFIRRSSVLGEYSLGGHFHYSDKWRPLKAQIGTPSDLKKYAKISSSRFRTPKHSFSRVTRAPSSPDQHTTDKTEASEKIEIQTKSDILVFCFLSTQKIVFAFGYLILHRLQLGAFAS